MNRDTSNLFSCFSKISETLPLKKSCERKKFDKDDVKIIIDGQVKRNLKSGFRKFWYWLGIFSGGKTQRDNFRLDLEKRSNHYVEFWADRTPILNKLTLDFGGDLPKRTPTVYDPKWTENFLDDPVDILLARLIFGEAEDQLPEAKIWIAVSVLNRMRAKAWPDNIHDVVLQPGQYDPFKPDDPNFSKVINPLEEADNKRRISWFESYEIAVKILSGEIKNSSEATHFHGRGVTKEWFMEYIVPNGRFLKKIDDTYFYWSPN